MITSYTTLLAAVGNYLSRDDLTNYIPDFIRFAEERLTRDLRVRQMLKVATTTTDDGDLELPTDFVEMNEIHLQGSPNYTLEYQAPDLFYKSGYAAESGVPRYFSIMGDQIYFAPQPSDTYTAQMLYYAKPTLLSSTNETNIYSDNFPDALLYATLAEAEPFLMNDERIAVWASMYDRAIQNIRYSDHRSKYPNVSLGVTVG
jgi:hypothetical protein